MYFTLATVALLLWGRLGSMSTAVLTDYIIGGLADIAYTVLYVYIFLWGVM